MEKTFDETLGEYIETPMRMQTFFNDIEIVCKTYNLSISHEDNQG